VTSQEIDGQQMVALRIDRLKLRAGLDPKGVDKARQQREDENQRG
jgi:hypothetical protein